MARPKDADAAATYDSIVRAALEVLGEVDNPSKVSMRGVAVRAEVSLGTIQYHFANKDALLEACLDGYYERLGALAQELMAAAHDPTAPRETFVAEAVRTMYRFVRHERAATVLRLVTTTAQGELNPTRQPEFMGALISACAQALAPFADADDLDLRLSIQGMSVMLMRFALLSDGEITTVTGLDEDAARQAVEDYVVRAACRLVKAPEPQS
jgi:AcrR family transcriptional regulator